MSEDKVDCHRHGRTRPPTFACVHLTKGKGHGVKIPEDATEPWPVAICDLCSRDPEWTQEEAVEKIRLFCKYCWEDMYGLNTKIEQDPDPDSWIAESEVRAAARQDRWLDRFAIERHRHYQMELHSEHPWLGFGESATKIHVRGDAIVIGSWARRSNTWLWGWGNSNWETELTAPIVAVKRFGEVNGLTPLWRMSTVATEEDSFALAACALDLLPELEGLYRIPDEGVSLFLGVRSTRYVS